ncbi:MAG: PIN domain-containing protein [Candidatus Heimdallarchaeota archaeon]|nr:PIN domain-containing protein [Candidatus Heimdallarchaeota archaeon]
MKLLLDTSFLIALKKRNPKAVSVFQGLIPQADDLLISTLSVYELLSGAHFLEKKYHTNQENKIIRAMLSPLTEIPVTRSVVEHAAQIRAQLLLAGKTIPDIDLLIACSSSEALILTYDHHFTHLEEFGFYIKFLSINPDS